MIVIQDYATWNIVVVSLFTATAGYITLYYIGYWWTFRADYRNTERSVLRDVVRLQLIEQTPNIATIAISGVTQGALIGGTGMNPVLAANLASWFGPHKIVNLLAMATSNSMKKAWVDGSWSPVSSVRNMAGKIVKMNKRRSNGNSPV